MNQDSYQTGRGSEYLELKNLNSSWFSYFQKR